MWRDRCWGMFCMLPGFVEFNFQTLNLLRPWLSIQIFWDGIVFLLLNCRVDRPSRSFDRMELHWPSRSAFGSLSGFLCTSTDFERHFSHSPLKIILAPCRVNAASRKSIKHYRFYLLTQMVFWAPEVKRPWVFVWACPRILRLRFFTITISTLLMFLCFSAHLRWVSCAQYYLRQFNAVKSSLAWFIFKKQTSIINCVVPSSYMKSHSFHRLFVLKVPNFMLMPSN